MEKIKIGIIGAGMIAESAHIPALLKSDKVEFSVIIEPNKERVKSLNKKFGLSIPHIPNINELKYKIDAAIICTPNDTHKDLCFRCFDLGIHVLVEKPLANTYQDSLEIFKKAKETNCIIMTGYCTRFWPSVQFAKEVLDKKALGEVKRFVFQYGVAGGWAPYSNYTLSKKQAGGGAFIINGSHYLDRMLWYFGVPDEYSFSDDSLDGIEANAIAEFNYSKRQEPFKGILRVSKTVNLESGCFIECEKGILIHRDWKEPSVSIELLGLSKNNKFVTNSNDFLIEKRPDMYLLQLEEFIAMINSQDNNRLSSIDDAIENVRITEELYNNRNN